MTAAKITAGAHHDVLQKHLNSSVPIRLADLPAGTVVQKAWVQMRKHPLLQVAPLSSSLFCETHAVNQTRGHMHMVLSTWRLCWASSHKLQESPCMGSETLEVSRCASPCMQEWMPPVNVPVANASPAKAASNLAPRLSTS